MGHLPIPNFPVVEKRLALATVLLEDKPIYVFDEVVLTWTQPSGINLLRAVAGIKSAP